MTLIAVKSLALTLGKPLFSGLSFTLSPGDRLALVAANGRGKSALLACLAGQIAPQAGEITRARGLTLALVAQEVPADLMPLTVEDCVLSALPSEARETEGWRAAIAMDDLAVPDALRRTRLADLSGGWQRTALLARAAVTAPDLYLLDEPTNHLDLERMARLADWLAALPRETGVILTSHDRAFLDQATGRTLFLRPVGSPVFALPYGRARAALDQADRAQARQAENDQAAARQLRRQAAKLKNIGINSGSDLLVVKTRQLTERAERIEANLRPAHRETSAGAIRLHSGTSHAKALLTLDEARIATPDGRLLFTTGRLWVEPGDRVVVLGPNGAGKSRLVAAIRAAGQSGAIRLAASAVMGHASQDLGEVPDSATPFDLVSRLSSSDAQTRAQLAGAGILPDWQGRTVARLSGGQKARLAFLLLRLKQPNLYLLDEPTNHLDIEGQETLEAELLAPDATCLLVSHDRHFVRATANRFWEIRGRRLIETDSPEPFFAALAGRPG